MHDFLYPGVLSQSEYNFCLRSGLRGFPTHAGGIEGFLYHLSFPYQRGDHSVAVTQQRALNVALGVVAPA
jgi:hypothetical protein